MKKLLEGLSDAQREAVLCTDGPLLVLAGAGSGKTRVVTTRIAHLLHKRVRPEAILAVTFTNKAAAEMRERVAKLVGKKRAEGVLLSTFHSFCVRVLRKFHAQAGLPERFTICDAADQLSAFRGALRELHVPEATIQPRALQSVVSLAKNRMQGWEAFLEGAADDREELIGRAWKRYEERLARAGQVDFDDLLVRTVLLLRGCEEAREPLQDRFRYLMVDEYQDTNGPQYELVRILAGERRNVCVVGDDDQSIYGWRGADVTRILSFDQDFPGAKVVRLETSYRSTQDVLDAANTIIANNPARHDKSMRSARGKGEPVKLYQLDDEAAESTFVVREIVERVARSEAQWRDHAILLRTAPQARAFEGELRARNAPYVLVGGQSFFDRKEIRDVLAYLKLLVQPDDEVSFLRILNAPPRGVGKASVEKVLARATEKGISAAAAFDEAGSIEGVPEAAAASAYVLREMLKRHAAEDPGERLVEAIHGLLKDVDYRREVEKQYPDPKTQEERWAGVGEILNLAENYVRRTKAPTLVGFLEEVALAATDDDDGDEPGKRDAITLMTLHAAKGLEFRRVYLVGMEEGLLPHAKSVELDTVEEERRLCYVGVTRAMDALAMTLAKTRARFGSRVPVYPSRFLYELKGEPPPDSWVPAGEKPPPPKKKAKKRRRRARAR